MACRVADNIASHSPQPCHGLTQIAPPGTLRATAVNGQVTGAEPTSCNERTATNGQPLPDPICTPGVVSTAMSQNNLNTTICRSG